MRSTRRRVSFGGLGDNFQLFLEDIKFDIFGRYLEVLSTVGNTTTKFNGELKSKTL